MKILLIGGSGFLGTYLSKFFLKKGIKCRSCGRNIKNDFILNKYNEREISKIIFNYKPDVIINLVSITNVDECEKNLKKAKEVNTDIAKNISNVLINQKEKIFFYTFTDQVYNSKNSKENKTNLINNYAKTKIKAEKFVIKVNGCVVRTNFLVSQKEKIHFLIGFIHLLEKKKIHLFSNVFFHQFSL